MRFLIVLGTDLNPDCTPGENLLSRLEETVLNYKPDNKVIVSGARKQDLAVSEAKAMQKWLRKKSIDSILEERAMNIYESAVFCKVILKSFGVTNVTVITSDFQIPRTSLIFLDIMPNYKLAFNGSITRDWNEDRLTEFGRIREVLDSIPLAKTITLNAIDEVKRGHLEGLQGQDLTVKDENGMTALHWSASLGYTNITSVLSERINCNISIPETGLTPLHCAIINLRLDTVWVLLNRGAHIDTLAMDHRWTGKKTCEMLCDVIDPIYSTIIQLMMYKLDRKCVLFMRCAQSMDEYEGVDIPLCKNGEKNARFIGRYIADYNLLEGFTIVSSPLFRALETTRLMVGKRGVYVSDKISEQVIDFYSIGKEASVLKKMYTWKFDLKEEKWWWKNGTEPSENLRKRVRSFLDYLASIDKAFVITHSGVIKEIFGISTYNCESRRL